MIKKISLFFSAIAIGILSIFSGISLKNAAKPQYFLENTKVKERYISDNNNFNILEIDPAQPGGQFNILLSINTVYLINDELYQQNFYLTKLNSVENLYFSEYGLEIEYTINEEYHYYNIEYIKDPNVNLYHLQIENITIDKILLSNVEDITLNNDYDTQDLTMAFDSFGLTNILDNELILPTIDYFNQPEPTPPLEQINTLVSDIINWFKNIFNGLGNVFYDPTANKLTAWGTVLFIGVAIMLISMALKWVISLIRGV